MEGDAPEDEGAVAQTLDTEAGSADARAYATVAELRVYATDYGRSLTEPDGTDLSADTPANTAKLEVYLRQGTLLLGYYADRWPGQRATGTQRLDWPRVNAVYLDKSPIDSATVPGIIKDANCEAALHAIANPTQIRSVVSGQTIKSVDAKGVKVEYFATAEGQVARATFTALDDLLSRLLTKEVTQDTTTTTKKAWLVSGGGS